MSYLVMARKNIKNWIGASLVMKHVIQNDHQYGKTDLLFKDGTVVKNVDG